jgi:hypothetical protein
MPPEAVRLFMSLVCSDFAVGDAPTSAQFTVEFQVSLPIEIAAGSSFTIAFAPVKVTGVLSLILDNAVDLRSCMSVEDHVITVTAKGALAAGSRRVKMAATFNGDPTAAGSVSAHLELVVNTLRPVQDASKDILAKCSVTIRNPMKDAVAKQQEQVSPSTAASAVAEQHTQLRPEPSSCGPPSLAPAKRAPAAATSTPPYPPFLSESAITLISSKMPSPSDDALSPAVAEAAAVMQNEVINVQRAMRFLQQAWVSLHRISTAASGMTHSS